MSKREFYEIRIAMRSMNDNKGNDEKNGWSDSFALIFGLKLRTRRRGGDKKKGARS